MDESYSTHRDQLESVEGIEERRESVRKALEEAFQDHIFYQEVPFIKFGEMTAEELAEAFVQYPIVMKSILSAVNVATRAIERDLDIKVDTYDGKIDPVKAGIIAGYVKPILPDTIAIPALCELDRYSYVDKELRRRKGGWEKAVLTYLNANSTVEFKKRKFEWNKEKYEIDAASPPQGDVIEIAVDIKRIEARRDTHKRADEIVNKAKKFKEVFPNGKFFAILYYPFTNDHLSLMNRLQDTSIDGIYFASENNSSIEQQVRYVLGKAGVLRTKYDDCESDDME